jgi:hypothetical protein
MRVLPSSGGDVRVVVDGFGQGENGKGDDGGCHVWVL